MLDIKTADIRQTRFYQEVLAEGHEEAREEGREEGRRESEATLLVRLLSRRLGVLSETQTKQIGALSLVQLDQLSEEFFDLADLVDLDRCLANHPGPPEAIAAEEASEG